MRNYKNISFWIIMLLLGVSIIMCVCRDKYEISVALAGILASIFIPFGTKDLELEKHQKQLLYEKKFEAYSKYFEIFDEFWRISGKTLIDIHLLNTEKYNSKEDFEKQKGITIASYKEFKKIRDYLSMPNAKILVFINEKINKKINEIRALELDPNLTIDSKDELKTNINKMKKYIGIINELLTLLKEDLGIKEQ